MQTNTSSSPGETQINKKIISTPNDLSLRTSHREQDYPCPKRAGGRPSNKPNKQLVVKVVEVCFLKILAELLLTRDISFNIHVEITNEIDVNTTWGVI